MIDQNTRRIGVAAARRIVGVEFEEDICHEAIVKVLETTRPFTGKNGAAFETYFHAVVRNEALQKLRRDSAKTRSASLTVSLNNAIDPPIHGLDPEQLVLQSEASRKIMAAIHKLSPIRQGAILDRYFRWPDETVEEIASRRKTRVDAFKSLLCRSRQELASYLQEEK